MNLWPFRATPPSIEDSARDLGDYARLGQRERIKARTRIMRAEMGLPPLDALRG